MDNECGWEGRGENGAWHFFLRDHQNSIPPKMERREGIDGIYHSAPHCFQIVSPFISPTFS